MSNDQRHHRNSWKAWVAANGRLHVHAEIYVADKSVFYQLDKQDPQGYYEDELMLVVKPKLVPGHERLEVKYHEDLESPYKYKTVSISSNNQPIGEISEVEETTAGHATA
jgi:hypothetical protein